jgi:hypothetical protein
MPFTSSQSVANRTQQQLMVHMRAHKFTRDSIEMSVQFHEPVLRTNTATTKSSRCMVVDTRAQHARKQCVLISLVRSATISRSVMEISHTKESITIQYIALKCTIRRHNITGSLFHKVFPFHTSPNSLFTNASSLSNFPPIKAAISLCSNSSSFCHDRFSCIQHVQSRDLDTRCFTDL